MPVARYGDNATPYPLYAGSFGMQPAWTPEDMENLGRHFDALYGTASVPAEVADRLRSMNPRFQILRYQGNWRVSGADAAHVEAGHRDEILYYRVGRLARDLPPEANEVLLEDLCGSLVPSEPGAWSTWLRVGTEYLRIVAVEGGPRAMVERGLDDTPIRSHAQGTPVLAPVYGRPPTPGSRRRPEYRQDPRAMLRWNSMLDRLEEARAANEGGIWIDILIGQLSQQTVSGESVPNDRLWNLATDGPYDWTDRARFVERGVRFLQEEYRRRHGVQPVIWGNNLMHPVDSKDPRLRLLLSTEVKPRPIDGFAQENSYGGWGAGGNSGKTYSYKTLEEWIENTRSILFMGELKVAARPLLLDGGIDNLKFASLPAEERHRRLLYGYASYLLAVRVEPDDRIHTALGLCPLVNRDGPDPVEVDPCFRWNIGRPVETRSHTELERCRLPGRGVFVRRFEHGLVLVNPSDQDEADIDLETIEPGRLINPDDGGRELRVLSLPARTGAILLHASVQPILFQP